MLLVLVVLAGCADLVPSSLTSTSKPTPPNQPAPTQPVPTPTQTGVVTISPQNAAAAPGQTVHFTATAAGGGAITFLVNGVAGVNATVMELTQTSPTSAQTVWQAHTPGYNQYH